MTLKEAEQILADNGIEDARHEARIIFAAVGGEPIYKLLSPSYECENEAVAEAVLRRAKREPLAYIIGWVDFYNERYKVTPDCLIPRPDTEVLVDFAVDNIPEGELFLDLCTGSGCVAISTLCNTKNTRCTAVDISEAALTVAKENAAFMEVSDRIDFIRADVTSAAVRDKVFAVLSNPPYVSESAYRTLEPEIFREPSIAFLGGEDGGDFYRILTPMYREVISDEGFIAYEIGYDQADLLKKIAMDNSMRCSILRDLSGNTRVAVLRKIL